MFFSNIRCMCAITVCRTVMTNNALYSRVKDVSIGQPTLPYMNTRQRKSPLCISATVRLTNRVKTKPLFTVQKKSHPRAFPMSVNSVRSEMNCCLFLQKLWLCTQLSPQDLADSEQLQPAVERPHYSRNTHCTFKGIQFRWVQALGQMTGFRVS